MSWLDRHARADLARCSVYSTLHTPQAQLHALELCRLDPVWFVNTFIWTFNPKVKPSCSPMVLMDWQEDLLLGLLGMRDWSLNSDGTKRNILGDKSREMGFTYVVLCAMLWTWLFKPGSKQGVMSLRGSEVWNKTEGSLFGKLRYMYQHLPIWMRPARWDVMFGASPPVLINPDNGSSILGANTTGNAFRGDRMDRVFVDEGAMIGNLEEIMHSLGEVGPWVVGSTPKGMGNYFARMVHRKTTMGVVSKGEDGPGAVHLSFSYTLDPRKDEAWEKRKRAELSDEAWAQEYGLDYNVSAPGRIWPHFDRHAHVYDAPTWSELEREGWLKSATLLEGWDFGSGRALTAVVWAAYVESIDTIYLLDYRQFHECHVDDIAAAVGEAGYFCKANPHGLRPRYRVGDIAGRARDSTQQSWIGNLKKHGINVLGQSMQHGRIEWSIQAISKAIRDERLWCAPAFGVEHKREIPTGVDCLEQYRRGNDAKTLEDFVGEAEKPVKDIYSHLADAVQHIALKVWPRVQQGTITQDDIGADHGLTADRSRRAQRSARALKH